MDSTWPISLFIEEEEMREGLTVIYFKCAISALGISQAAETLLLCKGVFRNPRSFSK